MPSNKHRSWVVLVAILGLVGLAFWAYSAFRSSSGLLPSAISGGAQGGTAGNKTTAGSPTNQPGGFALPVETARVMATEFALVATAVGSLRSNESVVLRPEIAGRISSIDFKDGSEVNKGALLVGLDAATQRAEYEQAKANLRLAQANLKRSRELIEKKFLSQQALDNTQATLEVQKAALALAQARLDKTRIRAPFSGVVGIRNVSVGDYVKEGQELINLEDISILKIDFRLPEAYLGQIKPGQAVEASTDALPGQTFEAVLDAINPLFDTGGRAISCRAHLSNADGRLRPGMFVRVRLIFEQRGEVLMIPEQAIVPDTKSPFVYRVVAGKAVRVPVKTGSRRNAQVEIVEGLEAGDEIVIAGQLKLRDGAPVMVIGGRATAPAPPAPDAQAPVVKTEANEGKAGRAPDTAGSAR